MEDKIFINNNHSYAFIFSKPKSIKKEQSEFLSNFWEKFHNSCKVNALPVVIIEMSKEKIYIQNKNIIEVNEQNVSSYIRALISVLRRYKEKDNTDNIEKVFLK